MKFENCTLFTKCFTNIDGTTKDNAEDLDLVMPMYKIEYISNYSYRTSILWFFLNIKQLVLMLILGKLLVLKDKVNC